MCCLQPLKWFSYSRSISFGYCDVPVLFEQLSSRVRALCVARAELLKVFSWDREMLTLGVVKLVIETEIHPATYDEEG